MEYVNTIKEYSRIIKENTSSKEEFHRVRKSLYNRGLSSFQKLEEVKKIYNN